MNIAVCIFLKGSDKQAVEFDSICSSRQRILELYINQNVSDAIIKSST
ncbi:hypothetical protein JPSP27_10150 [Staphylococcus pseudintermedius]